MQGVTLLLIIIGSIIIVSVKPIHGLIVFIVGLTWYPQPLTVSIATIDISLSRALIFILLANIFFRTNLLSKLKWNALDTVVMLGVLGNLIALSRTVPPNIFLEREGGGFFDIILPYFAIRLILNSKELLITFIKNIILVSIPIVLLGCYQSITGHDPLGFLRKYYSFGMSSPTALMMQKRMGFYRASGTFGSLGAYGLYFAGLIPLTLSLWYQQIWSKKKIIICFVFMLLGALSSMSSAPLLCILTCFALIAFFPIRKSWPVFVFLFVIFLVFVEFYSNRHWYEVLTRLAFDSSTAYYRIGLFEEAFGGGMTGHWLEGYGYVGVGAGTDNTNFNWFHKDFVNIYIAVLARFGLLGLIPFLMKNFLYYRYLYVAGKLIQSQKDLWLVWCIMATFGGWNVAMMTINAMGQVNVLLHICIGISSSLPAIIINENNISNKT